MARDYQTKANVGALPDTITATRFGAGEFNSIAVELENAVTTSDQTLAPADGTGEVTDQLAMALAIYGAGGAFYHADTGAVNAYVLTPISPKESPPAYFDGFTVIFEAGTVNTTASTVNVNSLGVKDITYSDGNALVGGELSGSCGIKYNLSDDRFELLFSSGALAGLSPVYVIDASQADQGAASSNPNTYTVFDAAAAIGTTKNATLYFPHNPVAGNQTLYTFDTSLDLSSYSNLKFKIDQGAQFDRTTGDEVFTIYSPENLFIGSRQQITAVDMLIFDQGGMVYADWFGSIQYAIDSLPKLLNDDGGVVKLNAGTYAITSGITVDTNRNLKIRGEGKGTTIISGNFATGDMISIGDTVGAPAFCSIEGLSVTSTVIRTADAAIRFSNGHNIVAKDIRLESNMFIGFALDGGADQFIYRVYDFEINSGSSGITVGIDQNIVQDTYIENGTIDIDSGDGVILYDASGIYMSNVSILTGTAGVTTYPAVGDEVTALLCDTVLCDNCSQDGWQIVTNGGDVTDINIVGCWGSSCLNNGIRINAGAGKISSVQISSTICTNNEYNGIAIEDCDDVTIINPSIQSNSQAGSGLYHGVNITAAMQQFSIAGGVIGSGGKFASNLQGYGIIINAGASDNYTITGVNLIGNVTGPISDGGTGQNKVIAGNIGYMAPLEKRVAYGDLAPGVTGDFAMAWQNPHAQNIIVTRLIVYVTTPGGTAGSLGNFGNAATSTTESDNIIDGIDLNAASLYDNIDDQGTNGQSRALLTANGGGLDWLTGRITVANASNLAGKFWIEYVGYV